MHRTRTVDIHSQEHPMATQQMRERTTGMALPNPTRRQRVDRSIYRSGRHRDHLPFCYWAHALTACPA